MLFIMNDYYPNGGMEDFINSFDDLGEAIFEGNIELDKYRCATGHVYDLQEMVIVKELAKELDN